jgi:hypothetical protein
MKKITLLFCALIVGFSVNAQVVTISHSTSQEVVANNTVACPTEPTSYWRVFDLDNEFNIQGEFEVTAIEFGVEIAQIEPSTIRLYIADDTDPTSANLEEIYSGEITLTAADQLTVVTYTLTNPVTLPQFAKLAVEIGDTVDGVVFRIGSNEAGESADSWLTSDTCGAGSVTSFGFTNHYVMNVTGEEQPLSINDNLLSQVSIYPTPAIDVINIKTPASLEINEVLLFDLQGRNTGAVFSNGTVNVSELSRGVYMLTLNTSEGTLTQKVVKK